MKTFASFHPGEMGLTLGQHWPRVDLACYGLHKDRSIRKLGDPRKWSLYAFR
jgi:hypothetical protein